MKKAITRSVAVLLPFALVVMACSDSGDDAGTSGTSGGSGTEATTGGGDGGETATTAAPSDIDYEALGLWDDGPCDESKPPLVIGLMTVFESGVLSLKDQATALEASATAFNARGGANGSCIQVHNCDDGGTADQALSCVRDIDEAGVMATVNDQGTAGQADVSAAMQEAGIPRVASNVVPEDAGDQNAYPLDASGTGVTLLSPQALILEGISKIGIIRVDLAAASAISGIMGQIYNPDAEFPFDGPVPAGTTDYSQFILGAEAAGAEGVTIALGENEAVQVLQAAQQLGSELKIGASLGTFSQASVADLGDYASNIVFLWSFPPATADVPVYEVLRADLAASGDDALQPQNLKASPMRSWIGLYALLKVLRDQEVTDLSRESISAALQAAEDVPMLGMFGDEDWTPNTNHEGFFQRGGMNHWQVWTWDPDAEANGIQGNFVPGDEMSFDEVLCDSPLGGPCG